MPMSVGPATIEMQSTVTFDPKIAALVAAA